jgi:hypothetical protein
MNRGELRNQFQADLRKFRRSTIERKQMSTKTTFKRIALVAVAALGLGVLSVAPSSAATGTITLASVQSGTAALDSTANLGAETTTAAIFSVQSLLTGTDSITVQFLATGTNPTGSAVNPVLTFLDSTSAQTGTLATNGKIRAYSSATADSVTAGNTITESTAANNVLGAQFALYLDSTTTQTRVAGTYNYLVIAKGYNAGVINDALTTTLPVSITIAAATSASKTPSAVKSFANLSATSVAAGTAKATSDAVQSIEATTGTAAGYIFVGVRNAVDGYAAAQDSLTAVVTGAGVVCVSDGSVCGKSISKVSVTGDYQFVLKADGTAGASSVAVTSGVLGVTYTKTLSYYAKAAKTITASVFTPVLAVGTNDSAVVVTAADANGTAWTGTPYIYAATAADALIGGSATTPKACVLSTDKTKAYCPVTTIAAGTASFLVIDASTIALATATSAAVSVTASAATAATVKIAFDKATYGPGEKAVVTVTPLDSAGKAIAATTGNFLAAALTSNIAFVSAGTTTTSLAAASVTTEAYAGTDKSAGAQSFVIYMPASSGTVTLTGKGGSSLPLAGQVAVTASASVVNASVDAATDAANEATDAANAATDAALAAADAADAATAAAQDASDAVAALSASVEKLVASLKAQLTSLTNLVIKIQKKVKA